MILVSLGVVLVAAIGSSVRGIAGRYLNRERFPFGTFLVNIVSSFLLGGFGGLSEEWRIIAGLGGLGALSTWSAVANEVAGLARARQGGLAATYLVAMTTTGIIAAWLGLKLLG